MEVEFRPTAEDYRGFYRYNAFRRNIGIKIAVVGLISYCIGSRIADPHFSWTPYLLDSLVVGIILFFCVTGIPYIIVLLRSRKRLKQLDGAALHWRIELTGDGFLVQQVAETEPEKDRQFRRWEDVKFAGDSSKYIFIVLNQGGGYVIPKSAFQSAEEASHFVFILEGGLEKPWGSKRKRAKRLYLWGLLGLIPNIGVIAGLIFFFKGVFQYKDKILVIIGVADILFTVLFWFTVIKLTMNSPATIAATSQFSRGQLNTLFRYVEFYKVQHGVYPDSLEQMDQKNNDFWVFDPLQSRGFASKGGKYFYKRMGEKYWLFSVGIDGKPFTKDDIYPAMNPADSGKFGLMKNSVY